MAVGTIVLLGIIAVITYLVYQHIKKSNERILDHRGYYRDGYGRLIHRSVAYKYLYDYPSTHSERFSYYDVHHIDGDKTNNSPDNLQILTRGQHKAIHGF